MPLETPDGHSRLVSVMENIRIDEIAYHRPESRGRSFNLHTSRNRGNMRNNYRRKGKKPVATQTFPQLSIQEFEAYCAIQLNDMVNADRYTPGVDNYGVQPFSALGLRDEGYGVIVRCKDGSAFVMNIKPLEDFNKDANKLH